MTEPVLTAPLAALTPAVRVTEVPAPTEALDKPKVVVVDKGGGGVELPPPPQAQQFRMKTAVARSSTCDKNEQ